MEVSIPVIPLALGDTSGLRPVAAPATPRASLLCIPNQASQWWEMMQKAAFWNIPLAIAAVGGYLEDYFNIVQGYKAIFLWYFPGDRYLAESAAGDPKRILFPMRDPSSYSPRNYTAGSGMWDIGGFMGVSKDLSSLAPAVDSFVSKVNVTIEQLTENCSPTQTNWRDTPG